MTALRRFLVALCVLLSGVAYALTPGERILLFGKIKPIWQTNFLAGVLDPAITFSRTGNATQFDATGKLTWAPVNEYINSTNGSNTARTITTAPGITYYLWAQTSSGTSTIVATGTASFTLTATTGGASQTFTATAGTLTLTPTSNYANITQVVAGRYTYESTYPRTQDLVTTAGNAYYGPRFDYNPATLAAKGLLIEEQRTNVAIYQRDLTNAAWSKSNITAALNMTGIDGVSNSASRITAGANNGTVLQAITLASSQRSQSAYLQRITGSGTVYMTTDGGTTWTDVTSQVGSAGTWALASIPAQTVTNPSIGFKLATSGDAIGVDWAQNENGAFPTSRLPPITTGTITRAADVASLTGVALTTLQGAAFTVAVEAQLETTAFAGPPVLLGGTGVLALIDAQASNKAQAYDPGSGGGLGLATAGSGTWNSPSRAAFAAGASGTSMAMNGGSVATGSALTTSRASLVLGSFSGGPQPASGWYRSTAVYNQRLPDATLKTRSVVGAPYQ